MLTIKELYPEINIWREPPYEYEFEKLPFDILSGSDRLRKDIEEGKSLKDMEYWWNDELESFRKIREKYLIYD
ncbi:Uncharacterized protein THER_2044 [Thermodesulfovibrio sp. N1]|nr:Uncharacterized protein THER_2044 [Thermodesulfovibrio sp. N1]